ncbi:MAG: pyridoxal 5'-phosphate synthase glutaminase subunit PdxT [Candidatus Marinimicrobia bacterium]|nr:pyridoxal 5'-phosphate synthase glutaminase subunit PdxT [Candidatus Neomarinimicrobiota bacterium]
MVELIGILALQGDFARHADKFDALGVATRNVRSPADLDGLSALVIPGGESTVLSKQLDAAGLRSALEDFARARPVMGTCAGLIMMGRDAGDSRVNPLGLMDITVRRNGWGRQVHSFETQIEGRLNGAPTMLPAIFIRAPRIVGYGPAIHILAEHEGEPVLVSDGRHLAMAFHPELTPDSQVHEHFLGSIVA